VVLLIGGGVKALTGSDAPSSEQVSAAFVDLYDYDYGLESPEATARLQQALASVPGAEEEVSAFETREVFLNGQRVATVMIVGIDPGIVERDPFEGMTPVPGSLATFGTGGPDGNFNGIELTTPSGYQRLFYDDDGLLVHVASPYEDHARAITSHLGLGNV
jgi:hypothetical protein